MQLVGSNSAFAGRIELCVGYIWTTVCADFWDDQDASVVCRQLGYSPYGMLLINIAANLLKIIKTMYPRSLIW